MKYQEVDTYLLSLPNVWLDYPFGEKVAVYKIGDKMFALIAEGTDPVRISLKCDPELSTLLREKYDEVMAGEHLNKKHWNTIVMSGQLSWEEVQDLIRHSYQLVSGQVV